MPKLKPNAINISDLIEYLDSCSDFSFELSVLKMLRENGLECEHGGLYEDPATGKSREFDIRAIKTVSDRRVRLAIECKNIRRNFPILISCIPRQSEESYHQIAIVSEPKSDDYLGVPLIHKSRAYTLSIRGEHAIYKENEPVGKSTAQVGRALDGSITANDGELYDKWSQAISSLADLASRLYWDGDKDDTEETIRSTIIPVIVVPNDRLWQVVYDSDGNNIQEPTLTDHCSCFIDKCFTIGSKLASTNFFVSHIEIMTFDGLQNFVGNYMSIESNMESLFPQEGIIEAFKKNN